MKVKFLPPKYIDVEICPIYENRDAVIIQHTDTLLSNTAYYMEALGFKYNIKPTAFHWPYGGIQGLELQNINETGVIKFGVYIPTDFYRGLTSNGQLPDYNSNIITSQFSANYYGKSVGDSKPSRVEQGQDLYDFTNGIKGYNVVEGHAGIEKNLDFVRELQFIDNWYLKSFGRLPSSGSDRQGVIGSKEIYLPYYLGIRKTSPDINNFSYENVSRLQWIHRAITSRYEYSFGKESSDCVDLLNKSIDYALNNKGMFNDFSHWHRAISHGGNIQLLEGLYSNIHKATRYHNVWNIGYSEAVEYYWYKTLTKRVRASTYDDKIILIADFDDELINEKIAGIPARLLYQRMHQPLSVNLKLKGTKLEGKHIKTNFNKPIFLGDDEYIVDIPFNGFNSMSSLIITASDNEDYKDFKKPDILSIDNGLVVANMPVKIVYYTGNFSSGIQPVSRSLLLQNKHKLPTNADIQFIGLINELGVSNLVTV